MRPLRSAVFAVFGLIVASCGPPEEVDPGAPKCVPGSVVSCPCAGGASGIQTCQSDGTFAACICGDVDASADVADTASDDSSVVDSTIEDSTTPDTTVVDTTVVDTTVVDTTVVDTTVADTMSVDTAPPDTTVVDTGPCGTTATLKSQAKLAGETDHSGIAVTLQPKGITVYTDADGNYSFPCPPLGSFKLEFSKGPFFDWIEQINVAEGSNATMVDGAIYPIAPITLIKGRRLPVRRDCATPCYSTWADIFSPDGKWLLATDVKSKEVHLVAVDGTSDRTLGVSTGLGFSPDSTRVVWHQGTDLYSATVPGGAAVKLSTAPVVGLPGGRALLSSTRIVYGTATGLVSVLYDGTGSTPLYGGMPVRDAFVSFDHSAVLFSVPTPSATSASDWYRVAIAGGAGTLLANEVRFAPIHSDDGKRFLLLAGTIYTSSVIDGTYRFFLGDASGNVTTITSGTARRYGDGAGPTIGFVGGTLSALPASDSVWPLTYHGGESTRVFYTDGNGAMYVLATSGGAPVRVGTSAEFADTLFAPTGGARAVILGPRRCYGSTITCKSFGKTFFASLATGALTATTISARRVVTFSPNGLLAMIADNGIPTQLICDLSSAACGPTGASGTGGIQFGWFSADSKDFFFQEKDGSTISVYKSVLATTVQTKIASWSDGASYGIPVSGTVPGTTTLGWYATARDSASEIAKIVLFDLATTAAKLEITRITYSGEPSSPYFFRGQFHYTSWTKPDPSVTVYDVATLKPVATMPHAATIDRVPNIPAGIHAVSRHGIPAPFSFQNSVYIGLW